MSEIRLEIVGKHRCDDLRVAPELVGKQRPDRPVDETGNERLAVGRPPLALQIAARDAAGGEGLFLIMNGEGEEVLSGLGFLRRDDGGEHSGLAPGGEHGAVGLTGHAPGFQDELPPAPVEFFTLNVKHLSSSCGSRMRKPAAHAVLRSDPSSARRRGAGRTPALGDPAMTRGSRMRFAGAGDCRRPRLKGRFFYQRPELPLTADAQALDESLVAGFVLLLHIVQQRAALRHHLEQAAAGVVVLRMRLEMAGQVGRFSLSGSQPAPRATPCRRPSRHIG